MNVVSECFVIESQDYGVEPVIYLNRPNTNQRNEKLHLLANVFDARKLIREHKPSVEVTVTSETYSSSSRLIRSVR